jgi:hypothetical protein
MSIDLSESLRMRCRNKADESFGPLLPVPGVGEVARMHGLDALNVYNRLRRLTTFQNVRSFKCDIHDYAEPLNLAELRDQRVTRALPRPPVAELIPKIP